MDSDDEENGDEDEDDDEDEEGWGDDMEEVDWLKCRNTVQAHKAIVYNSITNESKLLSSLPIST